MEIKRSGSQPAGKGPAEYFTGTVRVDPLFNALIPHACLALRSHLNLAPALHGTATRWARLLLSQRAAAWCSAGVDQLRKFDRVMWYGLHLVKSIGTAQRQPRR